MTAPDEIDPSRCTFQIEVTSNEGVDVSHWVPNWTPAGLGVAHSVGEAVGVVQHLLATPGVYEVKITNTDVAWGER